MVKENMIERETHSGTVTETGSEKKRVKVCFIIRRFTRSWDGKVATKVSWLGRSSEGGRRAGVAMLIHCNRDMIMELPSG